MPEVELEPGWVVRQVGATVVLSGVLVLLAALVTASRLAHGFTVLLLVLAVILWLNGGMLWWCGTKVRPAPVEPGRSDYDSV
jgi:Na+/melibiose symporter-like transporter